MSISNFAATPPPETIKPAQGTGLNMVMQDAVSGASLGANVGPWGAAAGAVGGALKGAWDYKKLIKKMQEQDVQSKLNFANQQGMLRNEGVSALNAEAAGTGYFSNMYSAKSGGAVTAPVSKEYTDNWDGFHDAQYYYTEALVKKYPNIPIKEILSNSVKNTEFNNKHLEKYASDLINTYGDFSLTDEEMADVSKNSGRDINSINTVLSKYDKNTFSQKAKVEGAKEDISGSEFRFGPRMMLQRRYKKGDLPYKYLRGSEQTVSVPKHEDGGQLPSYFWGAAISAIGKTVGKSLLKSGTEALGGMATNAVSGLADNLLSKIPGATPAVATPVTVQPVAPVVAPNAAPDAPNAGAAPAGMDPEMMKKIVAFMQTLMPAGQGGMKIKKYPDTKGLHKLVKNSDGEAILDKGGNPVYLPEPGTATVTDSPIDWVVGGFPMMDTSKGLWHLGSFLSRNIDDAAGGIVADIAMKGSAVGIPLFTGANKLVKLLEGNKKSVVNNFHGGKLRKGGDFMKAENLPDNVITLVIKLAQETGKLKEAAVEENKKGGKCKCGCKLDEGGKCGCGCKVHAEEGGELPEQFRDGGRMNIIPKGVLHAHNNKIGDKGIPVVTMGEGGEFKKIAEIERDEIIFSIEVTEELEKFAAKLKEGTITDDELIDVGAMIKTEITKNTVDMTGNII